MQITATAPISTPHLPAPSPLDTLLNVAKKALEFFVSTLKSVARSIGLWSDRAIQPLAQIPPPTPTNESAQLLRALQCSEEDVQNLSILFDSLLNITTLPAANLLALPSHEKKLAHIHPLAFLTVMRQCNAGALRTPYPKTSNVFSKGYRLYRRHSDLLTNLAKNLLNNLASVKEHLEPFCRHFGSDLPTCQSHIEQGECQQLLDTLFAPPPATPSLVEPPPLPTPPPLQTTTISTPCVDTRKPTYEAFCSAIGCTKSDFDQLCSYFPLQMKDNPTLKERGNLKMMRYDLKNVPVLGFLAVMHYSNAGKIKNPHSKTSMNPASPDYYLSTRSKELLKRIASGFEIIPSAEQLRAFCTLLDKDFTRCHILITSQRWQDLLNYLFP